MLYMAASQPVHTSLPAVLCPFWVSEDIEGGWLRFWGERRVSENANISVRLYFISSAAYTMGSCRPAVVFFLAAIASEIQVGTFSALSAMVSLLWGFPSQNLFLLKKLS